MADAKMKEAYEAFLKLVDTVVPAEDLGRLCDLHILLRARRLGLDKEAENIKGMEDATYRMLVDQMRNQKLSAVGGKKLRVELDPEPDMVPKVVDWKKFYAHILKTKDFSLLEKRVGRAAVKERWDDQQAVPGVEGFPVYKLHRHEVK